MPENYTRRMHADVDDKQLKEISLGQKVQIISEGEVCELRDSDSYEVLGCGCPGPKTEKKNGKDASDKKKIPASITIKVKKTRVVNGDYSKNLEDDED